MSILNTFYVLFKGDTTDLEKATQRADKTQKGLHESIKKSDEASKDLGKGLLKVAENAAIAVAGIVSVAELTAKVFDTAKFNSSLNVQGKILGQNTQDILTYGAAVEAAGGSVAGFQSYLSSTTEKVAGFGLKLAPVGQYFREIRKQIDGLTDNEKLRRLNLLGITDPGMIALLEQSNEEFERSIANAEKHAQVTQQDTAVAREFAKQWSYVGDSFSSVASKIGTLVLPLFTKLTHALVDINDYIARIIGGIDKKLGYETPSQQSQFDKDKDAVSKIPYRKGSADESIKFWLAQGYTPAQAAGLAANEQRESNFNPNAIGDNGQAHGLFQWHPDRVARILKATGIDVTNASHSDQLKAAAWELQQMGVADMLKGAQTPEQAADILTRKFERPANQNSESLIRGSMADQIYQQSMMQNIGAANSSLAATSMSPLAVTNNTSTSQGGDKNVNLKIDTINVNAPNATDAESISQGIFGKINTQLRDWVSNSDDGIGA